MPIVVQSTALPVAGLILLAGLVKRHAKLALTLLGFDQALVPLVLGSMMTARATNPVAAQVVALPLGKG